jgi:anthranilate synthase component II
MSKTIIIDNYDSFTFNLYHYVQQIDSDIIVKRNDEIEIEEIEKYDQIILSPGPGLPMQAGKTLEIIENYGTSKRILGICLGHQAIVEYFGGELENLTEVLHGQSIETFVFPDKSSIFKGIPTVLQTGRYHSFVANLQKLPKCLQIIATDKNGTIQGVKHRNLDIIGLQFHPESVMTEYGFQMIKNWMEKA